MAKPGNRITIVAGNHDVDLYWPRVQSGLREVAGPVDFELGVEWMYRYGGRLAISHGHQLDGANAFAYWNQPILDAGDGARRLEMCPGTLFMVKFVNFLERKYPFADNLKPFTSLIALLLSSDQPGLLAVAWMFFRFAARHLSVTLDLSDGGGKIAELVRQAVKYNATFRDALTQLAGRALSLGPDAIVKLNTASDDDLEAFLARLFAASELDEWFQTFSHLELNTTLGEGSSTTLGLVPSMMEDSARVFAEAAKKELGGMRSQRQVVVLGHTHQPDQWLSAEGDDAYFNPGSWTRFVRYQDVVRLTMEQLRNEEAFPYQLNYVRVRPGPDGKLTASMITFDEAVGTLFPLK